MIICTIRVYFYLWIWPRGRAKKDIYYIYGVSSGYIQLYSASTSDLVRPRPSASDEPNPRSRGYIAVYSPPRPHIYITYIPLWWCIYLILPRVRGNFIYILHICPEFGAKSTYISTYMPRVRYYTQQYSPELGIYVFLSHAYEKILNWDSSPRVKKIQKLVGCTDDKPRWLKEC